MEPISRKFVISAMIYFAVGATLGASIFLFKLMEFNEVFIKGIIHAHAHIMTVGFVSLMIIGISYHIIPRFLGVELSNKNLTPYTFWLFNIGIIWRATSEIFSGYYPILERLIGISGLFEIIAVYIFVFVILKTFINARKVRE